MVSPSPYNCLHKLFFYEVEPPSTEIETGKGTSTIVVGSIYGSTYGNGIDCKSKTTTTSYAYNSWQPPCEDIRTPQQSEDNTRSALHYYNENTHLLSLGILYIFSV